MSIIDKKFKYTIGIAYNLKKGIFSKFEDAEAEYDSLETIAALQETLKSFQCRVKLLEADENFVTNLQQIKVDIVFNIAEGHQGRAREAHIPSILSFLGIPFTGSDETTLCITLDKALAKRLLSTYGILTPGFYLAGDMTELPENLKYPLIVKPNAEGSSKGIRASAVVESRTELRKIAEDSYKSYKQSLLIEEFIMGREFTVSIVGNGQEINVFPPMEIIYKKTEGKYNIYSFHVKQNFQEYVEYQCPPDLTESKLKEIMNIARKIYMVLECRDFARIDFRMSAEGEFYFIEINPLSGLAPGYSDLVINAAYNEITYQQLIKKILNSALQRYKMDLIY